MNLEPGDVKYLDNNIAVLGCYNKEDGSGYIHCILQTFHPTYSRMKNGNYRIYLAKAVRLGAIPEIIRTNFKVDDLKKYRQEKYFSINNPYTVYKNASEYGVSLRPELLKMYAKYLKISYRVFDANLDVIDQYYSEENKCPYMNVLKTSDNEYHLLVRMHRDNHFSVLDVPIKWI